MALYSYKAKSGPADIISGTIQADTQDSVVKKLKSQGLFPVYIQEIVQEQKNRNLSRKISASDVSTFTRQLANLIRSGFNLSNALATLAGQTQNTGLVRIIEDIREMIRKGSEFSSALNFYPKVFSSFYVNLVKVGETTGKMDESLERLADFTEKDAELVSQVKSALTYPAFLFSVGLLTIFILVSFFIPRLVSMFADLEQTLPLATVIIINISSFMNKFWWIILAACGMLIAGFRSFYGYEKNRIFIDEMAVKAPLVRDIIIKMEIARFSYALGALLKSGVPILEALEVVTVSVGNRFLRFRISGFGDKIKKGVSLSACLKSDDFFPAILANMAAVGEESGELNDMLFRIAVTFENEVNRTVKTAVSLIEPVLILCIGGVVVLMVFAILLPIFQLDFFAK